MKEKCQYKRHSLSFPSTTQRLQDCLPHVSGAGADQTLLQGSDPLHGGQDGLHIAFVNVRETLNIALAMFLSGFKGLLLGANWFFGHIYTAKG
jgi:hypothetical protein